MFGFCLKVLLFLCSLQIDGFPQNYFSEVWTGVRCSYYFEMGLSSFNYEAMVFRILPKCSCIVANCHFKTKV